MDRASEIMYRAFFDELGHIERHRLSKLAVDAAAAAQLPGFMSRVGQGLVNLGQHGAGAAGKAIRAGYTNAAQGFAKANPDVGWVGRNWQGVKGALRTPEGAAAALGAGVLGTTAVGAGGLGYLHGRSTAAPRY